MAVSGAKTRSEFDDLYARGQNLFLHAEFEQALTLFKNLHEMKPDLSEILYVITLCHIMLNRLEEASCFCQKMHALCPDARSEKLAAAIDKLKSGSHSNADIEGLDPFAPALEYTANPQPRAWTRRIIPSLAAVVFIALVSLGIYKSIAMLNEWHARGGPVMSISQDQIPGDFSEDPAPITLSPSTDDEENQPALAEVSLPAVPESTPIPAPVLPPPAQDVTANQSSLQALTKTDPPAPEETPAPPEILPPVPEGPVNNIIDLQPYKTSEMLTNEAQDWVRLTNLNPRIGSWYVLETHFKGQDNAFHLEVFPTGLIFGRKPTLSIYPNGLVVSSTAQKQYFPLWTASADSPETNASNNSLDEQPKTLHPEPILSDVLLDALKGKTPLTLICGKNILVRTQRPGAATEMELATDLFRKTQIGDWFVEKVKPWLIEPPEKAADGPGGGSAAVIHEKSEGFPRPARIDTAQKSLSHTPQLLGIEVEAPNPKLNYGEWYRAVNHPGIYVSIMIPGVVETAVMESYPDRLIGMRPRDRQSPECNNVVYSIAFDLEQFSFGYCVGTTHPGVEWSERAKAFAQKNGGPDGFESKKPLVTVGAVPPYYTRHVVATFAGGFKRQHGAFLYGELSRMNNGSHFGFAEQGVLFSRLNPGLATVEIHRDGSLDLLTWPKDANKLFPELRGARQNGVAIVDGLDEKGIPIPGHLVKESGAGSWSGNKQGQLMTIRSAVAIQDADNGKKFFILSYFTGATPSGMARVFQSYGTRYAMGLDMNSPKLCYAALYVRNVTGQIAKAEYLIKEMASANNANGSLRFLQNNDIRDFFYILRREI